ncbi:MAG TPA: BamA/TamA family outer membrane protein [Anaeromyxobacteraceae bacterium]|nr:BamA/TamA family outer membrane protein [Anaeromyxobacteraceae bacterium]
MRRAAALALLLAAGCLRARGTPEEPVVTAVDLAGVKAVDRDDLLEKLATQPSRCRLWSCDAPRLDPDALAVDVKRVEAYYRERGYYQAAASAEERPEGEGRVRVVITVREGAPVRVAELVVEGLEAAPEARKAAESLPLRQGAVFTEAGYDAGLERLKAALRATGYATAEVTEHAEVLPEEGKATVRYVVTAGRRYRFGRVFVSGAGSIPRGRVVEQAEVEAKPGDWYDERKLAEVRQRVFDMGVFGGVRVAHGTPDPERLTVPIVVTVREAPLRTVRAGPGLGFQATRWEADALASWTHRNFLGDLRRLQVDGRAGYAWIPDPFSRRREGEVGLIGVELTQPGAFARIADLGARVEVERSLQEGYGFDAERLKLAAPLRLAPRWTLVPSWNLEVYQLRRVSASVTTPVQFERCDTVCLLSYLEQRVTWDGRDDPIATRRGLYGALSIQEGFDVAGHGYRFLRVLPEARAYLPLGADTVLAVRARAGALVPLRETSPAPIVALFTAGGATSMRGYDAQRLSPMALQDGRWVPTGGNGLLEGSLELRTSLGGDLGGALFLDAGDVSSATSQPAEWRSVLDPTRLQLALGVGLRYRTPFGPLRLDVAARLPTDWSAGVPFADRFPKVPGGSDHREPIAALHVTLGEAF